VPAAVVGSTFFPGRGPARVDGQVLSPERSD
jgi:hypothetical protein